MENSRLAHREEIEHSFLLCDLRNDKHHRALFLPTVKFGDLFLGKRDYPIKRGMDRKIPATVGILPGTVLRALLTHDNASGAHAFAPKQLYAAAFAFAIAPVRRRAASFLMCHG